MNEPVAVGGLAAPETAKHARLQSVRARFEKISRAYGNALRERKDAAATLCYALAGLALGAAIYFFVVEILR